MIGLHELLQSRGLVPRQRVKLARHRDRRWNMALLQRTGHFDAYQRWQSRPVFDSCDFVASFIGEEDRLARLVGVYHVLGRQARGSARLPRGFPYPEMRIARCFVYDLERDDRFADFEGRLVVDWGRSARAWVQKLTALRDKEVVELRSPGFVRPFPGYLEFALTYHELVEILTRPKAHRDWIRALSSVGAIYLIADRRTGNQYVGSAAGAGGLLTRWQTYVKTGHGGNKRLRNLLFSNPRRVRDLEFTVLQILDKSTAEKEALDREALFKRKLGTRAFGLNDN